MDLAATAARLMSNMTGGDTIRDRPTGLWAVAAARAKDEADQGVFIQALRTVVNDRKHGGSLQQYLLNFEDLHVEIDAQLRQMKRRQRALGSSLAFGARCLFFPNPRFKESFGDVDWSTHWSPRARGVESGAEAGSYFSGRTAILRELKDWLSNDSSDGRVRALTGKPGSGKSAVLAQLVLAAASAPIPGERPPTPIDVAFHAHGKNLAQLVAQISAGLGAPSATAAVVVESLARETRKRVLLIDALDEASDIGGIVDLILKLAVAAPALRIFLSAREDAFKRFPKSACVMLDLDDQRYWDHEDIRRYVERRLLEDQDSPYRRAAESVADLAETIAARADRSFLIAQVMTRILTRSKLMPPPAAVDLSGIAPGDLSEVFNRDLERFGDDREKVRDLLRPLAYAEGAGLPWETLWAAIASAISGHLYRDLDVRWLHEHASSYFIEDRESGYSVYRPYHQDFADFLCEPSRELDVQRLITAQLRANAPARDDGARDWARALPYVRSHLSAHAARAGQLDALLTDPAFLVAADPDRLVQHLPAAVSEAGKAAANVYLRSVDKFRSGEEAERMPYLDLAARQRGLKGFVKAGSGQERWPWRALWARWSQADPFRVLVRHDDWIPALLLSDLDGRSVVVSGSHKSGLKATSLEGALLWHDTEHGLTSVATATVAGRRLVVGGCHDGSVRLWELATGNRVGRPFAGHGGSSPSVRAVQIGVVDGRAAVVSAGNDGYLRISDLERQELLFEPIAAFGGSIQDMALGTLDGRAVIVAAASAGKVDDRNLLRVWDLAERRLMRKFSTAKIDFIRALALGVRRGKAIVALATAGHGGIHIVDLSPKHTRRRRSRLGPRRSIPLLSENCAVNIIFADMIGRLPPGTLDREDRSVKRLDITKRSRRWRSGESMAGQTWLLEPRQNGARLGIGGRGQVAPSSRSRVQANPTCPSGATGPTSDRRGGPARAGAQHLPPR